MLERLVAIIFLSLFCGPLSVAAGPAFDVVFDLDWTLFYPVKTPQDGQTIRTGNDLYQPADHAAEVLLKLHRDGHRVSLYSGGDEARNRDLAEALKNQVHALGAGDFSFYKILNKEDLFSRPGVSAAAHFAERYAKDLTRINPDLRHVVLVDDLSEFAMAGQEKNVFALGRTYVFYKRYNPEAQGAYDPPSEAEWRRERQKVELFYELFKAAQSAAGPDDVLITLKALNSGYGLCSKIFLNSGSEF